jgi:hypothetical protein
MRFDPYHKWLGIPPQDQPPNFYRLLGLSVFESDVDVIDAAARRQLTYLRSCARGEYAGLAQELMNEIAAARRTLRDPNKKIAYDIKLRSTVAAQVDVLNEPAADSLLDSLASELEVNRNPFSEKTTGSSRTNTRRALTIGLFGLLLIGITIFWLSRESDSSKPHTEIASTTSPREAPVASEPVKEAPPSSLIPATTRASDLSKVAVQPTTMTVNTGGAETRPAVQDNNPARIDPLAEIPMEIEESPLFGTVPGSIRVPKIPALTRVTPSTQPSPEVPAVKSTQQLLTEASAVTDDAAKRLALLKTVKEKAVLEGLVRTALDAIEAMGGPSETVLNTKIETLQSFAKETSTSVLKDTATAAIEMAQNATNEKKHDTANQLIEFAVRTARKSGDSDLTRLVTVRVLDIRKSKQQQP